MIEDDKLLFVKYAFATPEDLTSGLFFSLLSNVLAPPNRRSRLDEGPYGPKSGAGC